MEDKLPALTPAERDFADGLLAIAKKYGKLANGINYLIYTPGAV
jgi:hypothetical protein